MKKHDRKLLLLGSAFAAPLAATVIYPYHSNAYASQSEISESSLIISADKIIASASPNSGSHNYLIKEVFATRENRKSTINHKTESQKTGTEKSALTKIAAISSADQKSATHKKEVMPVKVTAIKTTVASTKNSVTVEKPTLTLASAPTKSGLPSLGNSRSDQLQTVSMSDYAAEEMKSAGEALGSSDNIQDADEYFKNRMSQYARSAVTDKITDDFTGWLNQAGKSKFTMNLDENWQVETFELDYLLPLRQWKNASYFTQMGLRRWQDRTMLNLGIGYRHFFNQGYMLGYNVFYDRDLTYEHQRASVGLEAANDAVRFYTNHYLPISSWQKQEMTRRTDGSDYNLEARAASGYDIGLTTFIPFYPQISFNAEYFSWKGQVDYDGDFHSDGAKKWTDMYKDPTGYNLAVEWRPIPMVGATLRHTDVNDDKEITGTVDLTYNFDQPLKKQLASSSVLNERLLKGMKTAFVTRENNVLLEYRKPKGLQNAKINITAPFALKPVTEYKTQLFSGITVESALPILKYEWRGEGAQYLTEKTDTANPVFTAPAWDPISDNKYEFRLRVTDEAGDSTLSDPFFVTVAEDGENVSPKINFTSDKAGTSQKDNTYEQIIGDNSNRIYWYIKSKRFEKQIGKNNIKEVNHCDNPKLHCTVKWSDADGYILDDSDDMYPKIENLYKAGEYNTAKLTVTTNLDGEINDVEGKKTLTVKFVKGTKSGLDWNDDIKNLIENDQIKLTYSDDSSENIIDLSAETHLNAGEITYESSDDKVAEFADKKLGKLTLKKATITPVTITVTQAANEYFEEATITTELVIEKAAADDMTWEDKENDGSSGDLVYSEATKNTSFVAQVDAVKYPEPVITYTSDNPGAVKIDIKKGKLIFCNLTDTSINNGPVKFTATVNASDTHAAQTITRSVNFKPGVNELTWKNGVDGNHSSRSYRKGDKIANEASSAIAGAKIAYKTLNQDDVEDKTVASVNTSGILTIHKTGYVKVVATATNNELNAKLYDKTSIRYSLDITSAESGEADVKWDNQDADNGLVKFVYGDNSNTFNAQLNLTNAGITSAEVAYKSTDETVATVAESGDKAGTVTIKNTGMTVIIASVTNADNYKDFSKRYVLYVAEADAPDLILEVDGTDGSAPIEKTVGDTEFDLSLKDAEGIIPTQYITYNTTDETVATVNDTKDNVMVKDVGQAFILATVKQPGTATAYKGFKVVVKTKVL